MREGESWEERERGKEGGRDGEKESKRVCIE